MRRLAVTITATLLATTALLATTLPLAEPGKASGPSGPTEQWRSFWADSFHEGIYTPEQVDKLVSKAKAVNANALIVQVSRWMDCFCNRSTFPRTDAAIAPAPYDPLEYVIQQAHAEGIEVHAWVNATVLWNSNTPPRDPNHIYYSHAHDATGADRWLNKRVDGAEIGGTALRPLDVANPGAVDYVVRGIESIVREYDVDGINLDYIRYPDYSSANYQNDWGYSQVSLDRFRAATGRTDTPEPTDPQFSQWRRNQVSGFVRKIYLTMYGVDPKARLSVNGITYWYGPQTEGGWERTRAYTEVLQDWKGWLSEGIIDTNVAMNYKRESVPEQVQMFQEWNEVLADWQAGRQNVVGPGIYLNTVEQSLRQARKALSPSAAGNRVAGWSGYSYAVPSSVANTDATQADAERAALTAGLTESDPTGGGAPLFAEPAAVPEMTWKTQPTKGQLVGTLAFADGTPLDQARVRLTNLDSGQRVTGRLSDGSGWFGFVDLRPGRWLVEVRPPNGVTGDASDIVRVTAGGIAEPELGPFTRR